MMRTGQMQELHKRVWTFRASMADVWPTPGPLDALRFATSESGEATSDFLRVVGGYARNNHHEPDVLGEAADCAMMLMTALGPDEDYKTYRPWAEQFSDFGIAVDWLAEDCGGLANQHEVTSYWWRKGALAALATVDAFPGMDLAAELDKRMTRIAAKHGRHDAATGSA